MNRASAQAEIDNTGYDPGTATDLVLVVTQMLREYGVVGRFVEFFGPGLDNLDLPDRATISNMCPEYGATAALFPVDETTLNYLRISGRDEAQIDLVRQIHAGRYQDIGHAGGSGCRG